MEELFADPAFRRFALQDHKRLPCRFYVRICGGYTSTPSA
jgi:hypothetical protein